MYVPCTRNIYISCMCVYIPASAIRSLVPVQRSKPTNHLPTRCLVANKRCLNTFFSTSSLYVSLSPIFSSVCSRIRRWSFRELEIRKYSASTRLLSRIILKSIHSLHQSRSGNSKRISESLKNKKKKKSHYVACPYYIKSSADSGRILPIRPEVKHWEQ